MTATTKINRKDFGLNWNKTIEAGGVMVGDDVTITVEVELHKQGAADRGEVSRRAGAGSYAALIDWTPARKT